MIFFNVFLEVFYFFILIVIISTLLSTFMLICKKTYKKSLYSLAAQAFY